MLLRSALRREMAVILRGGSDALESNKAIVTAIRNGLKKEGIPEDAISLIEDTSHETAREFMRMNGYLDVLIPRGGAGLIRTVVENSTVPVIETGTGNCHIYVDESADFDMALDIILMRRPRGSVSATPANPPWYIERSQRNSCR